MGTAQNVVAAPDNRKAVTDCINDDKDHEFMITTYTHSIFLKFDIVCIIPEESTPI